MRRTARIALVAGLVVAGATAGAGAALGLGGDGMPVPVAATPPATAPVTRADLVDYVEVDGTLGFGAARPLRYTAPVAAEPPADPTVGPPAGDSTTPPATPPATRSPGGPPDAETPGKGPAEDLQRLVTWLAPVGSTVRRGAPLFRVDNAPVVLLVGAVPVYRSMRVGTTGPDVAMLERNLRALGYSGFTADETYSAATASAVRRWQRALGVPQTGVVAPGQAIVEPGAVRVAGHALRVGGHAEGEILLVTGTVRVVTAELEPRHAAYARKGVRVTVTVADGRTAAGMIAASAVATAGGATGPTGPAGPGGEPGVSVTVGIKNHNSVRDAPPGPVRLRLVADERSDVLTVPVPALVALAEGGYGVEVVDGDGRRYVAVETGLFAGGRVEVTGAGLRDGQLVVVPK
jgi:peptidoglycan hydrolase-like protein with peptidoglycan-binding domain